MAIQKDRPFSFFGLERIYCIFEDGIAIKVTIALAMSFS
jgi:hypothetical protein